MWDCIRLDDIYGVEEYVAKGADINLVENEESLWYCIGTNKMLMLSRLLELGADASDQMMLSRAVDTGNLSMFQILYRNGCRYTDSKRLSRDIVTTLVNRDDNAGLMLNLLLRDLPLLTEDDRKTILYNIINPIGNDVLLMNDVLVQYIKNGGENFHDLYIMHPTRITQGDVFAAICKFDKNEEFVNIEFQEAVLTYWTDCDVKRMVDTIPLVDTIREKYDTRLRSIELGI